MINAKLRRGTMRIVVTGGSGYLGKRLFRELLSRGADHLHLVNIDQSPPEPPSGAHQTVLRNVTDVLDDLFVGADIAVHLAWILNPTRDLQGMTKTNLGGTRRFLSACAHARVPRVILLSSATAYGARPDNPVPILETFPVDPTQAFQYAREKAVMEGMAMSFASSHPQTTVVLARPSIVVGPHVSNYISRAIAQRVRLLERESAAPMQFVQEDDVARAIAELALRAPAGVYNVGGDGALTPDEMAMRTKSRVVRLPSAVARPLAGLSFQLGLHRLSEAPPEVLDFLRYSWVVDNRKLKDTLGFTYQYDSAAALSSFVTAS